MPTLCRWKHPLLFLTLLTVLFLTIRSPQAQGPTATPTEGVGPFPAEEALSHFVLDSGCRIELIASEPDVIDPVHVSFDVQGRMWVVEMTDYPNGPGDGQPGLSRIRVLTWDATRQRYTNPQIFAEKLLFANSLMFWKDGVLVTTDGKLQFMRDSNGDGRADETQVWFAGFTIENPQLRHNHPQLALDGKIYISNGLRGGNIVPGPDNPWGLSPQAEPVSISGRDFRFDPFTGQYAAIAGMAQFSTSFDQYGHRYVCTNRNPCRQIVLEDEQLQLTPGLRVARHYEDVAPAGDESRLYPISRTWTTSNLHANQFTAACGLHIHNDFALGIEFFGNSFTCDPTGNLVHRTRYRAAGPTFQPMPFEGEVEFLATRDEWFRPVNVKPGPGGALYVVDMYRAVIEHPQFMPAELKDRPDLFLGMDRGRVYRIVAADAESSAPAALPGLDAASLVNILTNPDLSQWSAWQSSHAFRLLLERGDAAVAPALRQGLPAGKVQAHTLLALLDRLDAVEFADLETYVKTYGLNRHSVSIGARRFSDQPDWLSVVQQRLEAPPAADASPHETGRVQEWYAVLGQLPWADLNPELRLRGLEQLIHSVADGDDPYWLATYLGLAARESSRQVLTDLLTTTQHLPPQNSAVAAANLPVVRSLAELVARQNQPGAVLGVLTDLTSNGQDAPLLRLAAIAGLSEGLPGGVGAFRTLLTQLTESQLAVYAQLQQQAMQLFSDQNAPVEQLAIATSLLAVADDAESLNLLGQATAAGDPSRASLALAALLKRPSEQANGSLVEILPQRRGRIRREILQAMAGNTARAKLLLDQIEAGEVAVTEVDANVERLLLRHSDQALVARAKSLVKREPPADRVQVLAEYQECFSLPADPLRGREVFEKNCATCHKIGDLGVNVAPDISDSRTKTADFLLTNILDPNRAIDANYFSHTLLDTSGRVHTGIIDSETAAAVTLKQPEGKIVTIPRDEIEEFKNNGVSLMPVGLERTINKQQMADLISFIKNWRYLDGLVPQEVIRETSAP